MWLTRLMMMKQGRPRALFSGKHRIPLKLNLTMRKELLRDLAFEEENLFYLRQPYLTLEQELNVSTALGKGKLKLAQRAAETSKMKKHVTIEDHLLHLRSSDAWE